MNDNAAIRERLEARFAPGWPASVGAPETWLPHLSELDAQLAALDPDYRLVQIKVKFGGLRYYIEEPFLPPCCTAWHEAHPLPHPADEAANDAWNAAAEEHDIDPAHVETQRAQEERGEKMRALTNAAEVDSYNW